MFKKKINSLPIYLVLLSLSLPLFQAFGQKQFIPPADFGRTKPTLTILKNDDRGVLIRLGVFPHWKSYISYTKAIASVPVNISIKNPSNNEVLGNYEIQNSQKEILFEKSLFKETGPYEIIVTCQTGLLDISDQILNPKKFPCWSQDIFVYSLQDQIKLYNINLPKLIGTYSPLFSFAVTEQYFPASIEYLMNKIDTNSQLDRERVLVKSTAAEGYVNFEESLQFFELSDFIKSHGNKNFMIDMGYQGSLSPFGPSSISNRFGEGKHSYLDRAKITIYFSIIPSRQSKDIIFLNFHTLYAYDSKGGDISGNSGSTGMAAHAFDRESISIKLKLKGDNSVAPVSVIFGAHLPGQIIGYLDTQKRETIQWYGDGLEVPWNQVYKLSDTQHPLVAVAHGSHALYPKNGRYGVFINRIPILTEQAGGGDVIIPARFEVISSWTDYHQVMALNQQCEKYYSLKPLIPIFNKNELSDEPNWEVLNFSGNWITIFGGKPSGKFPPFTHRESDPDNYSSRSAKPGETPYLPALHEWN